MEKVIVYGLGQIFKNQIDEINEKYQVVGYSDIDIEKTMQYENGVRPKEINKVSYDFVLVTSDLKQEIANYLVEECMVDPIKIKYHEYEKNKALLLENKRAEIGPSYAEQAEDYIISMLMSKLKIKYSELKYIELGVNEPVFANNTYFFYERGARGILVEANPFAINLIRVVRMEDEIIQKAVYEQDGAQIDFYVSEEAGLSSLDENHFKMSDSWDKFNTKKITVDTITIDTIMRKMPKCDLLSIDLEGYDVQVLKNLDFKKYRPKVIVIEMLQTNQFLRENEQKKEILIKNNYSLYAFTKSNGIWVDNDLR